jgi:hypothetical protein
VGGTNALDTILTDALGSTHIDGGTVRSSGNQTFQDPVIIGADTVFTGAAVSFSNKLDANGTPHDVTVTGTGSISFAGVVGGTSPLKAASTSGLESTSVPPAPTDRPELWQQGHAEQRCGG